MTSNKKLMARRIAAVPRGVANAFPIFPQRAMNSEIWDVEGKRYIDFASGIAVLNVGHSHPRVQAALIRQIEAFQHVGFQVTPYEPYIALAERLNKLAPIRGKKKTIFFSTGAEAVENAVKIARAYTRRSGIITFTGGFHGRTLMTMAMTGKVVPYKAGFGPLPGEVYHVPFPVAYHDVTAEDSFYAIESLFKGDVDASSIAAIVIEPVQGEGGFYAAPFSFLKRLRQLCDEHGIVFVADEIQSGFARTGKMFGIEHSGVEPDLITVAKSLAAGLPLSGVIGKANIMDAPVPGGLGGTYAGNPIGCAAAHAVLDIINDEKLIRRAEAIGRLLTRRFKEMAKQPAGKSIGDIHGLGAMTAIELVKDRKKRTPAPELAKAVSQCAQQNGLLLLSCGLYSNVLRILAPLTISYKTLNEGIDILEKSLLQAAKTL
jgi:4-aminobutyrate aminotransferase/(S)-3-amino-2-methylpropionate transaminase